MARKKLTASSLNKLNSSLNQQTTITVCGDYEIQIDTIFRESKIQKLVIDYLTILQNLHKLEKVTEETIINSISLVNVLIIKYFSNAPIPDIDDLGKLIQVSDTLLDLGITKNCFEHFPQSEIDKVKDALDRAAKESGRLMGEMAAKMSLDGKADGIQQF